MIGYKNDEYINSLYFSAKLDDLFNYIPERVIEVFIIAHHFLGYDYKNIFKIYY